MEKKHKSLFCTLILPILIVTYTFKQSNKLDFFILNVLNKLEKIVIKLFMEIKIIWGIYIDVSHLKKSFEIGK